MKLTNTLVGIALLAVLALATVAYNSTEPLLTPGAEFNRIETNVTNTSSTVSTTALMALDVNSSRVYAALVNNGSNAVYLSLKATSTGVTPNTGILLTANGGSYEITPDNLYIGPIYAITASGTSSLTIVEK